MPEPLKNLINEQTVRLTADALSRAFPGFEVERFNDLVLPTLQTSELMQRSQLIAHAMEELLPDVFPTAAEILHACLPAANRTGLTGWSLLAFNQYVGARGTDHPEIALNLLKALTPHFTAEFGIRSIIAKHPGLAITIISGWTKDKDHYVRRLASEGTRPRLPWAMRLPELVKDPTPILPILRALIDDPQDYVRRSVANNLNDIAKDHPDLVADFVARHVDGASKERLWLLKHASRTLIKKGHAGALANFGYAAVDHVTVDLTLKAARVDYPGTLAFVVELRNTGSKAETVMLDYIIHHRRKDGSQGPKVFKGKSLTIAPGDSISFEKSHPMRPITTRAYYPGEQRLEIQINGAAKAGTKFDLVMPQ